MDLDCGSGRSSGTSCNYNFMDSPEKKKIFPENDQTAETAGTPEKEEIAEGGFQKQKASDEKMVKILDLHKFYKV